MYKGFKDDIRDVAAILATDHYPDHGLNEFHITLTNAEFDALHLTLFDEDGNLELDQHGEVQRQPRKAVPGKPVRPHANVGAAGLAYWKDDVAAATSVALAKTILKQKILDACGPTIRATLSTQMPGGLASQSIPMILQYLEIKYGILTGGDIRQLREKLATKFTTPAMFTTEVARFQQNLAALELGGDIMSQAQLCEFFEDATKSVAGIPEILARYNRHVPIVANRILNDLFTAVELELPLITTTDARYVNNVQQLEENDDEAVCFAVSRDRNNTEVIDLMKKVNLRMDHMETTLRNAGRGNPNSRGGHGAGRGRGEGRGPGRGGAAGRGPGTVPYEERPTLYCFEHGFNKSYAGKDCQRMINDATYTADMKSASGPCKIGGYEGRK
jgi:hypothetical protein